MPKLVRNEKARLEWDCYSISEKYDLISDDFFFLSLRQIGEGLCID